MPEETQISSRSIVGQIAADFAGALVAADSHDDVGQQTERGEHGDDDAAADHQRKIEGERRRAADRER
jgi:hypothetical protein